MIEAVAFLLLY